MCNNIRVASDVKFFNSVLEVLNCLNLMSNGIRCVKNFKLMLFSYELNVEVLDLLNLMPLMLNP